MHEAKVKELMTFFHRANELKEKFEKVGVIGGSKSNSYSSYTQVHFSKSLHQHTEDQIQ